ncbi:restriction endonuclease subunit S [Undibacterium sp. Di24W]|uniref:restriction endonuclease subunit S n=1 Tax=Undibacterium sp. Di24W TaxID=3413033 RepID=UPI003BF15602
MSAVHKLITDHLDIWTAADTEKKSGRGRASGNANSVYGIKKLRELILELAVRGKLVPQDASDEPASSLLQKISIHKSELISVGRQKKETQSSPIKEGEKRFKLPIGWEWVRFGDALINRDAERKPIAAGHRQDRKGLYDYYGASGVIDKIDEYLFDKPLLLIGEDGANLVNRSTPIAFIARGKYWVNNHAHVLDGFSEDYLRYIELFVNAIDLKPFVTGTAQPKMNQAKMNSIVLAIPPEAEQHRIVAKVDELMALCDQLEAQHNNAADAHEQLVSHLLSTLTQSQDAEDFNANWQRIATHFDTLFTTESSIDALKQTLLQLAVMGKLVPQDPNDEPASQLLKRIQNEKAKLVAEGKIRKDKPSTMIEESEKNFALPRGWKWVRFNDYATDVSTGPFGSMIHQSDYVDGGVPLINPSHMIDDRITPDWSVSVSTDMAATLETYKIYEGDIVMARRGEVGRIALVTKHESGWLCGTGSFVLRFSVEVLRDYLRVFFRCEYARTYLAGEAVGTTMVNLNHGILKKMPIGLPPLEEQHRIVAKVDELIDLCEQLKHRIKNTRQQQQKLARTLIEHALVA